MLNISPPFFPTAGIEVLQTRNMALITELGVSDSNQPGPSVGGSYRPSLMSSSNGTLAEGGPSYRSSPISSGQPYMGDTASYSSKPSPLPLTPLDIQHRQFPQFHSNESSPVSSPRLGKQNGFPHSITTSHTEHPPMSRPYPYQPQHPSQFRSVYQPASPMALQQHHHLYDVNRSHSPSPSPLVQSFPRLPSSPRAGTVGGYSQQQQPQQQHNSSPNSASSSANGKVSINQLTMMNLNGYSANSPATPTGSVGDDLGSNGMTLYSQHQPQQHQHQPQQGLQYGHQQQHMMGYSSNGPMPYSPTLPAPRSEGMLPFGNRNHPPPANQNVVQLPPFAHFDGASSPYPASPLPQAPLSSSSSHRSQDPPTPQSQHQQHFPYGSSLKSEYMPGPGSAGHLHEPLPYASDDYPHSSPSLHNGPPSAPYKMEPQSGHPEGNIVYDYPGHYAIGAQPQPHYRFSPYGNPYDEGSSYRASPHNPNSPVVRSHQGLLQPSPPPRDLSPLPDGILRYEPAIFKRAMIHHMWSLKETAIEFIKEEALKYGFSVLVRTSKPDYVVVICNCGRRLKRLKGERKRNRRFKTAMTGCEWRVVLFRSPNGEWEFRATTKMDHNHGLPVIDSDD
ncbi:uncharacterized protein EV422DRAFT_527600 [Fimicolochytrium jonesii]|uniref:uncharacterized protein n=1 Tax=Fimicolochytrium jonesii TaxID=1396493 RepID=UPI0022FDCB37|nr:uncharacterized protein EV422DRAFT_527600 [Fimicolochytrium jonesii]KAI8821302.1 hypothetical protein EV422DRAFT_527600 [Fimicolochytrium jonesii]